MSEAKIDILVSISHLGVYRFFFSPITCLTMDFVRMFFDTVKIFKSRNSVIPTILTMLLVFWWIFSH